MAFGLDRSKGWLGRRGHIAEAAAGAAERELLAYSNLTAEAGPAGLMAATPAGSARAGRLLGYAGLVLEIARRGGQVEMLARAASAAHRARREAGADKALVAVALLQQAEAQRLGFALFGDAEAAATARACADDALALNATPIATARLKGLKASLDGALALSSSDTAEALSALEALEVAIKIASTLAAPMDIQAALILDRLELMLGLGLQTRDRALPLRAAAEAEGLLVRLDVDRLPISWARTQALRGQALASYGDLTGDAKALAEAVAALTSALEALPYRHSPLDEAKIGHALGLALQALGEASDEEALFDRAVRAYSTALELLETVPALPYRIVVVHDGSVCLARRAERRGDLAGLEQAEFTFREALKAKEASADPLAWAVTQVALARIYEAQAQLRPDTGERADAAFALTSALDVFAEHGLRSLSAAALSALERIKANA